MRPDDNGRAGYSSARQVISALVFVFLGSCASDYRSTDPGYSCLVCCRLQGAPVDGGWSVEGTFDPERWYQDKVAEAHDHTWVRVGHGLTNGPFSLMLLYQLSQDPGLPPEEELGIRVARALARASPEEREQARQELIAKKNFWEIIAPRGEEAWARAWDRWVSRRPTWNKILKRR